MRIDIRHRSSSCCSIKRWLKHKTCGVNLRSVQMPCILGGQRSLLSVVASLPVYYLTRASLRMLFVPALIAMTYDCRAATQLLIEELSEKHLITFIKVSLKMISRSDFPTDCGLFRNQRRERPRTQMPFKKWLRAGIQILFCGFTAQFMTDFVDLMFCLAYIGRASHPFQVFESNSRSCMCN